MINDVVSLPIDVSRETVRKSNWFLHSDQPLQDNTHVSVEIRTAQQFQKWNGFAGAVSELGAKALMAIPASERDRFFVEAFSREKGIGLDWIRLPVGASDFALDAYSHSMTPDDFEMQAFSLERDIKLIIPFIRAAKAVNPGLRIHASPWSPPGWMKLSGRMDGVEKSEIRDEPAVLRAYARYLRRFVEAYAGQGLPIDRLMVQNEIDSPAPFPGCRWDVELFVRFHTDYLRDEFAKHGVSAEVWAGTFRTMSGLQSHQAFESAAFRQCVKGAAFQYSFPRLLQDFQLAFPGTRVMHTETVCHNGANTWVQAASQFDDVMAYLNANVDVFSYWNMVLDQEAKSGWGWKQNSMFTADVSTGKLRPNPDADVFRLFSRSIQVGARRVQAFSYLADTLCFRNPDGSVALFLKNLEAARTANLVVDGKARTLQLPERSLCVFRL
jgi:glucosylceramidase